MKEDSSYLSEIWKQQFVIAFPFGWKGIDIDESSWPTRFIRVFEIEQTWCSQEILLEYREKSKDNFIDDIVGFWLVETAIFNSFVSHITNKYHNPMRDLSSLYPYQMKQLVDRVYRHCFDICWVKDRSEVLTCSNSYLREICTYTLARKWKRKIKPRKEVFASRLAHFMNKLETKNGRT